MKITCLVFTVLTILSVLSCRKDEQLSFLNKQQQKELLASQTVEGDTPVCMIFGTALTNPYTVVNMQAALATLQSESFCSDYFNVRTTHYYIRFAPVNEDDYQELIDDTTLVLYDYPLDKPLLQNGNYFRDATLSESQPNYQYACVKSDYTIPNVPHTILANLYIPEEDPDLTYEDDSPLDSCIDRLVGEALRRTGNLDSFNIVEADTNAPSTLLDRRPKWNPWGIIRYYDDVAQAYKPVKGAKVRVRRWFTTRESLTNAQGYFYINEKFRRDVNYSIKWERQDFDLRSGTIGQAYFNGPKQTGAWVLNIGASGLSRMYALVHTACIDYFYNHQLFGLTSPPKNSLLNARLKVAVYYINDAEDNGVTHPWSRVFGVAPVIDIYKPSRDADRVYGTAIHELGHYTHWGIDHSSYNNSSGKVAESWCRVVQWVFANYRYKNLFGLSSFEHYNGWQIYNLGVGAYVSDMHKGYTPLFVDLIDNVNQRTAQEYGNGNVLFPNDPITTFTIKDIEDALSGSLDLDDMNTKLKTLNKASDSDMDNLFNFYDSI